MFDFISLLSEDDEINKYCLCHFYFKIGILTDHRELQILIINLEDAELHRHGLT